VLDYYRGIHHHRSGQQERSDLDESGFTLLELLIVIVVLGVLAAVTTFGLSGITSQSAVSACHADARTVEVAVEAYHARTALWPPASDWTPLVNGSPVYLRTPPNSDHYKIKLGAQGQVMVDNGNGAGFQDYDATNRAVCENVK
jgi:prepilin-type N-terminal cleavage/methylation domain-containing protein